MCAFDKDSSPIEPGRRRAALVASLVPAFTSAWLLLLPRHSGFHPSSMLLGLGVGIAFGVGILALRRLEMSR